MQSQPQTQDQDASQAFLDHIHSFNNQQEFQAMQDRNKLEWLKTKRIFLYHAFNVLGYKTIAKDVVTEESLSVLSAYVVILERHARRLNTEDSRWVLDNMFRNGLLEGDINVNIKGGSNEQE